MTFFDFLQLVGGLILAFGYLPQIKQLLRTKSCGDLNLKTYLYLTLGIGLMEIYAVDLSKNDCGYMFLITNTLSLILVSLISTLIIRYRLREYNRIMKERNPDLVTHHAYYVTKWEDGSKVITPCEVNVRTKEITKIYSSPYDVDSTLESEALLLYDTEYEVYSEEECTTRRTANIEDNWVPW